MHTGMHIYAQAAALAYTLHVRLCACVGSLKQYTVLEQCITYAHRLHSHRLTKTNYILNCHALHCVELHCTALHCTALRFTEQCCTLLQCDALPLHNRLHCIIVCAPNMHTHIPPSNCPALYLTQDFHEQCGTLQQCNAVHLALHS